MIQFNPNQDIDEMTLEQLKQYQAILQQQIDVLDSREPADPESDEYEEWADQHEELEDLLDDIQDRLDDLEE